MSLKVQRKIYSRLVGPVSVLKTCVSYISLNAVRQWTAAFIRDCICKTLDAVVGNKETNYRTILQLDAKIKAYAVPVQDSDVSESMREAQNIGRTMQLTCSIALKDICEYLWPDFWILSCIPHCHQVSYSFIDDTLHLRLKKRRMIH